MKEDKFLIGIIIGIVLVVVIAIVTVLWRTPENEEYIVDDIPAGVVHNYFLAIQRKDYEKAYSYLSDELESKPSLDKFIRDVDSFGYGSQASLKIGETHLGDVRSQVDVSITTYQPGNLFENSSYTNQGAAYLLATTDGAGWKLTEFPYPYWGYDWNETEDKD
jgi:hypothetical protein